MNIGYLVQAGKLSHCQQGFGLMRMVSSSNLVSDDKLLHTFSERNVYTSTQYSRDPTGDTFTAISINKTDFPGLLNRGRYFLNCHMFRPHCESHSHNLLLPNYDRCFAV